MSTASSELVTVPKFESKPTNNDENDVQKDTMELKKELIHNKEPENGVVDQLKSVNGVTEDEKMEIEQNGDPVPKQNGFTEPSEDEEENKLLIDTESTDSTSITNEDELLNTDEESEKVLENGINYSEPDKNDDVVKSEDNKQKENNSTNQEDIKTESEIKNDTTDDIKDVKMEDVSNETSTNKNSESKFEIDNDIKNELIVPEDSCTENEEESKKQRIELQMKRVEILKEDLLREEATLSLFRKLFDSQRGKNGFKSKPVTAPQTIHPKPTPQPTPKQTASAKTASIPQNKSQQGSTQPAQKFYIQVGNQLVPAPPPSSTTSYQHNGTAPSSNTPSIRETQPSKPAPPPQPPAPPKQTPEQKKNAAKAALRRQLEQTLLQIPPPRPPPADWNAIPNVNSIDFMMLVGLDEVVDTILSFDNKPTLKNALEELRPFNPRICAQCKVDFSPCWKAAKGSNIDEYVLCENCSLQNVKKELKAEHTSRLKSAFMKALKQEQEIEEKIKAGEEVDIPNVPGADKHESRSHSPKVSQNNRISSPKLSSQSRSSGNHAPSPPERTTERHHQSNGSHHSHGRHQVVQHYPHHSLVQQLHHQHIQQQQVELEPTSRHSSSRWHPYTTSSSSSHHREHHPHHRSYVQGSSSEGSPRQEYYVVHHPHHYVAR
eukprot:TCONS_00028557-protein